MVRQIVIEFETPGDSRTMFRLRIDDNAIADDLTEHDRGGARCEPGSDAPADFRLTPSPVGLTQLKRFGAASASIAYSREPRGEDGDGAARCGAFDDRL